MTNVGFNSLGLIGRLLSRRLYDCGYRHSTYRHSMSFSPLINVHRKRTSAQEVNSATSELLDDFDGVLAINSEPPASCDFLGDEASSIVDTTQRQTSSGHLI